MMLLLRPRDAAAAAAAAEASSLRAGPGRLAGGELTHQMRSWSIKSLLPATGRLTPAHTAGSTVFMYTLKYNNII